MRRFLGFALVVAWLAAGLRAAETPAVPPGPARTFDALARDYLKGYFAWRPPTASGLGFHDYDGRLTDFSRESLAAELARLKDYDARVGRFDTTGLDPETRMNFRVLQTSIKREIFGFEDLKMFTRNPMTYAGAIDISPYIKRDFAPLEQRAGSIVAILRQAPALFAAARTNLEDSLPKPFVETAIEQAEGTADFLAKDLVTALRPLKDAALVAEFGRVNAAATNELRNFAAWLKTAKLPHAGGEYALGRARYRKLIEYGEGLAAPPEDLLAIGLRELHRKQEVFAETARLIDPSRKPIDVFKAIQHDHPTAAGLIPDTARNLEMIRRFVTGHKLITIPSEVGARVAETPQFLRATSFASMDSPGPFETKATEAYYYVTPTEAEWPAAQKEEWLTAFNYYTTDIVSIHEVYPGHYVQFLCLKASAAPDLAKVFGSYAFIEGWAHYTEQMMVDEGFSGQEPGAPADPLRVAKYRLAQTDEALLRVCRLCASIQMHCQGMTVDQAARFFEENCYYEAKPARQEAIRGTFDPEYLYYTLGKLEILKLREDYRRQEGAGFTLQRFHDEMLRHGAPPLPLLRELLLKDPKTWPEAF